MFGLFKKKKKEETERAFRVIIDSSFAASIDPVRGNDFIQDIILENNHEFECYYDIVLDEEIILCKNKPRDIPAYGIWFLEM